MNYEIISRKDQDMGRGIALIAASAVMVLLKLVLPAVAPLSLAAYGIYRVFMKDYIESAVSLGLAVLFWFLMIPLGWLLWLIGAAMAGFRLFFLIRGIRGQHLPE